MERNPGVPEPAVISQDAQTEIHVQAVAQNGRRQIDIRVWRRGAGGFTPSRTGLTLLEPDITALQAGIAELLHASSGGRKVARVVWDGQDGRRLRAETEPFGTRYVARFGFWQRVRDSWKPVDDGLTLAADHLPDLQDAIRLLLSWVRMGSTLTSSLPPVAPRTGALHGWPAPGADWLTCDSDRIALHPRGIRLTLTVVEEGGKHHLEVRQWRRVDTLWLPVEGSMLLTITDLDALLSLLLQASTALKEGRPSSSFEAGAGAGSTLCVERVDDEDGPIVHVVRTFSESTASGPARESRLTLPAIYLPRLGQALAQGWFLLAGWLSDDEREALQVSEEAQAVSAPPPETPGDSVPHLAPLGQGEGSEWPDEPPEASRKALPEQQRPSTAPVAQIFSFGAESETPGAVIPTAESVRIVVEGFMLPRAVTLPMEVVPQVVNGLEHLYSLLQRQKHFDPVLLCDRPDCAVYGRFGTVMRPDGIELRVWSDPTASDAISFEGAYLPDLIEGLRHIARLAGFTLPPSSTIADIPAHPPMPLPGRSLPARQRALSPHAPLEVPGPLVPSDVSVPLAVDLGTVHLGRHSVSLHLEGRRDHPVLELGWEGKAIELPIDNLEELLSDIRGLYYDALRGRRGPALSAGEYPAVWVNIYSHGTQLFCVLRQEMDGEAIELSFPANEVPMFLNAARAALIKR